MASDVWGFSKTAVVFICIFVVGALTTETEVHVDSGIIFIVLLSKFWLKLPEDKPFLLRAWLGLFQHMLVC